MSQHRRAATAVDLMIVLFIVALLLAAGAVAVSKAKGFADNNDQKANLKNLTTACRVMEVENATLPPAWGKWGRPPGQEKKQREGGVFVFMLPTIENKALFDSGEFSKTRLRVYESLMDATSPANDSGYTSFVANLRVFSTTGAATAYDAAIKDLSKCTDNKLNTEKIPDGAGNTVFFVTKYANCNGVINRYYLPPDDKSKGGPYFGAGNYVGPQLPAAKIPVGGTEKLPAYQIAPATGKKGDKNENACNNDMGIYGHSFRDTGLAIGMGDTSVRNLSFRVTGETYARALAPADGKALGDDW